VIAVGVFSTVEWKIPAATIKSAPILSNPVSGKKYHVLNFINNIHLGPKIDFSIVSFLVPKSSIFLSNVVL